MTTVALNEAGYVILDANGNGTAFVGPTAHGQVWRPAVVSVKVATAVKSPTCKIYSGRTATDDNFVDGTYSGAQNSSDAIKGQELYLGDRVWAVWTGGDVGAQATVTVSGQKDIT